MILADRALYRVVQQYFTAEIDCVCWYIHSYILSVTSLEVTAYFRGPIQLDIPVQSRILVGEVVVPRGLANANLPIDNSVIGSGQPDNAWFPRLGYIPTCRGRIASLE